MMWWWPKFEGDDDNDNNSNDNHNSDDDDDDDDEGEDDDIIHGPIPPDHLFKPQATKDWERCAVNFYFPHIVYLHKISRSSKWKTFNPLNYKKKEIKKWCICKT